MTTARTKPKKKRSKSRPAADEDALWYKDAIIYQINVRAFMDSDNDGRGDFQGLRQKLDYLQDLGVTALWLLPFYPSPLRDDGYDTSDYTAVHDHFGTVRDFQAFLREAHKRGLRVITELVLNHTSDQHEWFQRARKSPPNSRWRKFYVWSDDPTQYDGTRIIFKDFETSNWSWDPVAGQYYWHRFYHHQPDLNFDNPEMKRSLMQVVDFWMEMGVDGMRLDAVPYLYEREGTNNENLPETHGFLKDLRSHIDDRFDHRMLLAEANQWPEDAINYFGEGDECQMAFHFPVMPRLFMAVHMEDRFPVVDIMGQTPPIPDNCQWAVFLRNHDELTLEMVTDEDRDYMYRVYAQDPEARINLGIRRRLAPLLGNDRRRIELMNGLLFSLPGAPIIYYGDEIGMGDNFYLGDRNGVRTPMQWSGDRNAGFSRVNPHKLFLPVIVDPEYHYETVNVEAQQGNPHSLLWWMKRLIGLRKRHQAFARGDIEFLHPDNRQVLAFIRTYGDERILVVANLSRFVQYAELDLSDYRGMVPVELFGRIEFPHIGELPYFLTLGPHAFYWFELTHSEEEQAEIEAAAEPPSLPALPKPGAWAKVLEGKSKTALESTLARYLLSRRWFGGKARKIQNVRITEIIPLDGRRRNASSWLLLLRVAYTRGEAQTYSLPLTITSGDDAHRVMLDLPQSVLARVPVTGSDEMCVLYESLADARFASTLLDSMARRRKFNGQQGQLVAATTREFRKLRGDEDANLEPNPMRVEQSNTSIAYGDRLILKLFRQPDEGVNPDLEIGNFLTGGKKRVNVPSVAGHLEYTRPRGAPLTLGILQEYVPNEGDAWRFTLDSLRQYLDAVVSEAATRDSDKPPLPRGHVLNLARREPPAVAADMQGMGSYYRSARLLGERTAELHLALSSDEDDPDFAPEPYSQHYQRGLYQSMRTLVAETLPLLKRTVNDLPDEDRKQAQKLLKSEKKLYDQFKALMGPRMSAMRIRTHGDYHLGQVLYTGKDFVIIDFEGEPMRPLTERRLKRSPLRDVAGMLRSFNYAAYTALYEQVDMGMVSEERFDTAEAWMKVWVKWICAGFLDSYFETISDSPIVPAARDERRTLLDCFLLEKAVYELAYELNNRPNWVRIPLRGILELLKEGA